jgi:hypothetical protein
MNTEDIIKEWDEDSTVDSNHVDNESVNVPKLHAKYIRHLVQAKMRVNDLQNEYSILKKVKFRYYRGELSRDELKEYQLDQWQGTKPIKSECEQLLDGDSELSKLKFRIENLNIRIYLLESILGQIKARDWQLKNIVSWKQFIAGA